MATKKRTRTEKAQNVGILIDGGGSSESVMALRADLMKQLELATVMGRTEIAAAIIKALGETGGVRDTTFNNINVEMGT